MAQWLVNKLGKLMGVSVRTLHFYDKTGLLRPSIRLDNGYRLYSERDLQRLQHILALKFLGFDLAQIKKILGKEVSPVEHLQLQLALLRKKAQALIDVGDVLERIVSGCKRNESIDWQTIVSVSEVYSMVDALRKDEYEALLSENQLKDLIGYYMALGRDEQFVDLVREERELFEELERLMQEGVEPQGAVGIAWGRRFTAYGKRMSRTSAAKNKKATEVIRLLVYRDFEKRSAKEQEMIVELISRVIRLAVERCGVIVQLGPKMTVDMVHWMLAAYAAAGLKEA